MQRRGIRIETISTDEPAVTCERLVADALESAIDQRGSCLLALSGGRTPLPLFDRLAERRDLPWSRVEFFWGDERFVPLDHPDSNAGAAQRAMLDRLPVAADQIHRWPILDSATASAAAYERLLRERAGNPPLFDINLLGIGADCHTASLFPGDEVLGAPGLTVATRAPDGQERLSLTAPALSSSRLVIFLITGESKRAALLQLLAEEGDPATCPARSIGATERLVVVTDLDVGS